jgi:8-oxo-dGTP pyrophosphatase MutT (NUDIX family)
MPVVRLVVPDAGGRVLVLRRANSVHGGGSWCLPGGKVDYGQTVEEAAARELWEETSLACRGLRFLFYQDSPPPRPGGMHCINLYLECRGRGEVALNRESSQAAWVSAQELDAYDLVFRNDEGLRRYWGRLP